MQDIIETLKQGHFPNHKWSPLGQQLGLLPYTLSCIKTNHKDDTRCLQECLTLWLNKSDKVKESGGPTLDSLVNALKKMKEFTAAEKLETFSKKLFILLL